MKQIRVLLMLHLAANALLLWLAYEWLSVDESTAGRLVLSGFDALAIVGLACWLHGATMVWFASKEPRLNDSFRVALRHVGALLLLVVAGLVVYGLVEKASSAVAQPAQQFASWLTFTLRKPVKPAIVIGVCQWALWALRWIVLPVLLLPLAAAVAARGWSGWRAIGARRPWMLWVRVPVLTAAGLWLPLLLLAWAPKLPDFGVELVSFLARGAAAYGLFVASLVALDAAGGHDLQ